MDDDPIEVRSTWDEWRAGRIDHATRDGRARLQAAGCRCPRCRPSHGAAARKRLAWSLLALSIGLALSWALGRCAAPCETSDLDPSLTTCVAPWED